jgi:hypothetical protein
VPLIRRFTLVIVLVLALAPSAAGDSGFTVEGVSVSPTKVRLGAVQVPSVCDVFNTADCIVITITVTNTSDAGLFFGGAAVSGFFGAGIGVGFDNNGTCFTLADHTIQPGQSCTALFSCCGNTGTLDVLLGPIRGTLYLYGGEQSGVIAAIPASVRYVL